MGGATSPNLDGLSGHALQALRRLHLVARAWPQSKAGELGGEHAWRELLDRTLVVDEAGLLRPEWDAQPSGFDAEDMRCAARALDRVFGHDPWAASRAGSLHAEAGDYEQAERSFMASLLAIENASLRRQVWRSWLDALHGAEPDVRAPAALRSACLALDHDDVDVALRMAQLAATGTAASFESTFLTARAQLARGDLVAGRGSLERAWRAANDDGQRARVLAYQAEAAYVAGGLDDASALASRSLSFSPVDDARLHARNTLGKILLARSQWDAADAHFAEDEHDAACCGMDQACVRARVNRAIALLSKGRAEAARSMLEGVLTEAQGRRDLRAMAFALSNLAVLAVDRHDYAEALSLTARH